MKNLFFFGAVLLALLTTACNPKYYVPNTQNVPLMTHKGQSTLNVNVNSNFRQYEVQAAYAFSDNLAAQANFDRTSGELENGNGGSGYIGEVGAGYYRQMTPEVTFETYGLLGIGRVENHFPTLAFMDSTMVSEGNISSNLARFGIQPVIGWQKDNLAIAGSARVLGLSYFGIKGDLVNQSVNQVDYLKDNRFNFIVEPALTVRFGMPVAKLQAQVGGSYNLSNSDFLQDNSYLTFGAHIDISKIIESTGN